MNTSSKGWMFSPTASSNKLSALSLLFLNFRMLVLVCLAITPTGVPLFHSYIFSHSHVSKPCLGTYNCFLCLIESMVGSLLHFFIRKSSTLEFPGLFFLITSITFLKFSCISSFHFIVNLWSHYLEML